MDDLENPPRRGRGGRRPGDSGTRQAIATAARSQFASFGYDRTSMRSVAAEAGVDPALVSYFHRTKDQLFLDVVTLPFDPAQVLPTVLDGPREELGARLATFVTRVLAEDTGRQHMVGLVRAACAEPAAAARIRDLLTRELLLPLAQAAGGTDPARRASLAMAQIVGITMARHIVGIEPLASDSASDLAAALAPTLQRYLTAPDLT